MIRPTVENAAHWGENSVETLKSSARVSLLEPAKPLSDRQAGRGSL
ncbi:hypothetical protein RVR34_24735 [Microcystis aeruginosa FBCC-A68]|nr:hypothetical protein [Microcystis aeruginosa]